MVQIRSNFFFSNYYCRRGNNIQAKPKSNIATESFNLGCVEKIETLQVRDNSLTPLLNQGDNVKLYYGFYKCNQPQFGDIIAYRYTGNKEAPLAKIIKAVPGDRWEIRKDNEEFYQIFVNGTVFKKFRRQNIIKFRRKRKSFKTLCPILSNNS